MYAFGLARWNGTWTYYRSSYRPMLERIAGPNPVEPLQKVVADVVIPVGLGTRVPGATTTDAAQSANGWRDRKAMRHACSLTLLRA